MLECCEIAGLEIEKRIQRVLPQLPPVICTRQNARRGVLQKVSPLAN